MVLYGIYFGITMRIVSSNCRDKALRMFILEMPNVEKIYTLMMNIYIARAFKQFVLEEDLYAQLVFLLRSHETLIEYSRYKN